MHFDLQQGIFFVKALYQQQQKRSIITVQRAFKVKYHVREDPSKNILVQILDAVKNFEKHRSEIVIDPRKDVKSKKFEKAEKELVEVIAGNP